MITEEWAKNPKAEVLIECQNCHQKHHIEEILKEEPFPVPYKPKTTEVFWLCPDCGFRKHSFYMTPELRLRQQQLHLSLSKFNKSHESMDWEGYRKARASYQQAFDHEQAYVLRQIGAGNERPAV